MVCFFELGGFMRWLDGLYSFDVSDSMSSRKVVKQSRLSLGDGYGDTEKPFD